MKSLMLICLGLILVPSVASAQMMNMDQMNASMKLQQVETAMSEAECEETYERAMVVGQQSMVWLARNAAQARYITYKNAHNGNGDSIADAYWAAGNSAKSSGDTADIDGVIYQGAGLGYRIDANTLFVEEDYAGSIAKSDLAISKFESAEGRFQLAGMHYISACMNYDSMIMWLNSLP